MSLCLGAKVLGLILPFTLRRRGAWKHSPDSTCHWQSPCAFCVKNQLVTWSLACNCLSSYVSVIEIPVLSFPFQSLFLSQFTDLILLSGASLNLLKRFSGQRLTGETHDSRYPAWTIWMEPCLHKVLSIISPWRLGDRDSVLACFCTTLQHCLIKPSGSLLLDYCSSQAGIVVFGRSWTKVYPQKRVIWCF